MLSSCAYKPFIYRCVPFVKQRQSRPIVCKQKFKNNTWNLFIYFFFVASLFSRGGKKNKKMIHRKIGFKKKTLNNKFFMYQTINIFIQ